MAADSDADIKLTVDLTPGDVEKTSQELKQKIENTFAKVDAKGVEKLPDKLKEGFQKSQASISKTMAQLDRVYQDIQRITQENTYSYSKGDVQEYIKEAQNRVKELQIALKELQVDPVGNSAAINDVKNAITETTNELIGWQEILRQIKENKLQGIDILDPSVEGKINELYKTAGELNNQLVYQHTNLRRIGEEVGVIKVSPMQKLSARAKQAATNIGKATRNLLAMGRAKISGLLGRIGNGFRNIGKRARESAKGVGISFKQMLSYAIGIQGLFALFGKLRELMKEGFQNLAQVSSPVNDAISSMMGAFAQLKNALASAFAPILTAVAPIITRFINLISEAINRVGMFIAALTGQNTYTKALPVTVDYTESLNNTAKGAENAANATDDANEAAEDYKKTIAGFDDVNILQGPDKKADTAVPEVAPGAGIGDQFEEAAIDSKIDSLADKIKDLIKNQDWEGLGILLASKVNSIVDKLYRTLTNPELYKKLEKWINAITTTFNSLISHINWDKIGRTIGAGINLILFALNKLFTGIDWKNIGKAIAKTLNGLFDEVNWDLLGETVANGFNSVFDIIHGFLTNFDFYNAGMNIVTAIGSFFENLSWSTIGGDIFYAIIGLLNFLTGVIQGVDWKKLPGKIVEKFKEFFSEWEPSELSEALGSFAGALIGAIINFAIGAWEMQMSLYDIIKEYFVDKIKDAGWDENNTLLENGKAIIQGIFNGIVDALKNVGQWIWRHIFKPFVDGFKDAFDISSPSKKMATQGGYIIAGLLQGILSAFANIGSWIKENIFNKFMDGLEDAFQIAGGIAEALKTTGESVVSGIKSGVEDKWSDITTLFENAPFDMESAFEGSGIDWWSLGNNVTSGIIDGLGARWDELTTMTSQMAWDIYNAGAGALLIYSPSRVFRDKFGKMIPAGAAIGIEQATPEVLDAMDSMTTSIAKSAQDTELPMSFDTELSGKFEGLQAIGDAFLLQFDNIITRLDDIINNGKLSLPAVVSGGVVPYRAQTFPNTSNQVSTTNISMDELRDIIDTAFRKYMNITFYMGDEQVARHAQAGSAKLERRFGV